MRNIPKVAYFYWGGKVLPYLRYMSLYSFKKYNPEWTIKLYVPIKLTIHTSWNTCENKEELNTKDYIDKLSDIKGIDIIPFDMESIGYSNDLPEVIKSDIVRLYVLHTYGGLWSDSDILFFKPINHVFKDDDSLAYFCYRRGGPTQEGIESNGPEYHSIGFLMGAKDNPYFQLLYEKVKDYLNVNEYQSAGSPFYKDVININSSQIYNIPIDVVYPSRSPQLMFSTSAHRMKKQLIPITIGYHWYCGFPECGHYQNIYTEHTYKKYDNVITHLLKIINDPKIKLSNRERQNQLRERTRTIRKQTSYIRSKRGRN